MQSRKSRMMLLKPRERRNRKLLKLGKKLRMKLLKPRKKRRKKKLRKLRKKKRT